VDDAAVFGHLAEIIHAANHCEMVRTTLERCPHLCALYELVRERYFVTQYIAGGAPLPTVNAPNVLGGQPPAPGTWFTDLKQGGGVGMGGPSVNGEGASSVGEAEHFDPMREAVNTGFPHMRGEAPPDGPTKVTSARETERRSHNRRAVAVAATSVLFYVVYRLGTDPDD
jgi:hypothetical protein